MPYKHFFLVDEGTIIIRYCPVCGFELIWKDYWQKNLCLNFDICNKIWKNENIAILCCDCFNIVSRVKIDNMDPKNFLCEFGEHYKILVELGLIDG